MNESGAGEDERPCVLVIVGPTASGKTDVAIECAKALNAEIISADSRQIFRGLDIGTAKPTIEQRRAIVHHFIDEKSVNDEYSAGAFGKEARARISEIASRGKRVVVVGGSGLYVRAIVDGIFDGPAAHTIFRAELEQRLVREGWDAVIRDLAAIDPATAETIPRNNKNRLIRALEIFYQSGTAPSRLHNSLRPVLLYQTVQVGIEWERALLYRRIDERVDQMIANGFLEEAMAMHREFCSRKITALNTVGYKEMFAHLDGSLQLPEAIALMKQHTRNFAKRQWTWFRKDPRIRWFHFEEAGSHDRLAEQMVRYYIEAMKQTDSVKAS